MSTKDFLYIHWIPTKEVIDTETERPHLEYLLTKQFQESAWNVVNFFLSKKL